MDFRIVTQQQNTHGFHGLHLKVKNGWAMCILQANFNKYPTGGFISANPGWLEM